MAKKIYWQVMGAILGVCLILSIAGCGKSALSGDFPCGPKVLVFHATWCKWCPTIAEINQLQKDYPGCEIIDIDIDKNPELKAEYHVTRIPRFFICDDGGCRTTTSFPELKRWLDELR